MSNKSQFTTQTFPSSRQFTFDVGQISRKRHHVLALVELDVTEARQRLLSLKSQGAAPSFTAWFLKCVAHAAAEFPEVHAIRKGRNKLVVFDQVDIAMPVEKHVQGQLVPIPMLIRNVGNRSLAEVDSEIRAAKNQEVADESGYVLNQEHDKWSMRFFAALPQCLRLMAWKIAFRNPLLQKKLMGTIAVTSLGSVSRVNGWIVPSSILPLCLALGSIDKKPGVHDNQIVVRELLPVTVVLDHDVIDGAPAARFVSRLAELVESGYLLGSN